MLIFVDEELIRWGWPEDVWFHVSNLSSAHVYLRLKPGQTVDDIPKEIVQDCAQLVKANSIKGSKMNNIEVIYTMWANLKKTADMEIGEVGFHNDKDIRTITIEKKNNDIVNRLNKTKDIKSNVDFRLLREERDQKERSQQKDEKRKEKQKEKEEQKRKEDAAKAKSYDWAMSTDKMRTNEVRKYKIILECLCFNIFFIFFSLNRMVTIQMISCECWKCLGLQSRFYSVFTLL